MLKNVLSKIRLILKDIQQSQSAELAAAAENVYSEIIILNNSINKELDVIENKKDLNEIGKSNARRILYEKAGRKLEVIKDKINYSSEFEALEVKLADEPVDKDAAILKFLREKEIRDRLVGMTERQIRSHFGDSLFDGSNQLIMDAILNAPSGFELLPEEDLRKLRQVRAEKMDPKMAAKAESLGKFDSSILQMYSLAKKELDALRKKELPADLIKMG